MDTSRPETQVALILIFAAGSDGQMPRSELENMEAYFSGLLEGLENPTPAAHFLASVFDAIQAMSSQQMAEATLQAVEALKQKFSKNVLTQLYTGISGAVGDETADGKVASFLNRLRVSWDL